MYSLSYSSELLSLPLSCWPLTSLPASVQVAPDLPPKLWTAQLPAGGLQPGSSPPPPLAWRPCGSMLDLQDLSAPVQEALSGCGSGSGGAGLDYCVLESTPMCGDTSLVFETICFFPQKRSGECAAAGCRVHL